MHNRLIQGEGHEEREHDGKGRRDLSSQFRYRRRFGGIACGRWDSGLRSAEQRGAGRRPPRDRRLPRKTIPGLSEELGEPSETISCDLCVVGGGGTGLAAGIQAQQLGVDVVVLEKKNSTGGSFIGSEGLFAVGSHWQDDAGVSYPVDELAEACFDYHH